MRKVSFEEALENNLKVVLVKRNRILNKPIKFNELNEEVKDTLDDISYINFWISNKIYEVEE